MTREAMKAMGVKVLDQEPCNDAAKERYEDLCEYFGEAKDILKNREDFKAWLGRVKWHIHKAEELSAENDDLRDQLAMRDRFQKQEPCEDEYIKVPKKALKYRTAGMVAYNAEWLKNHFDIERAVICGEQDPCKDTISRTEVMKVLSDFVTLEKYIDKHNHITFEPLEQMINLLPSVNPTKTGHWWERDTYPQECECWDCSECQETVFERTNYCPNCGAKMEDEKE